MTARHVYALTLHGEPVLYRDRDGFKGSTFTSVHDEVSVVLFYETPRSRTPRVAAFYKTTRTARREVKEGNARLYDHGRRNLRPWVSRYFAVTVRPGFTEIDALPDEAVIQ